MRSQKPRTLPANWPRWKRQCETIKWGNGQQCKQMACMGAKNCKRHGGAGEVSGERAWKRYLLWILLPDVIRYSQPRSPVLDDEVEIVCQIIAHAALYGDQHASDAVRMAAAEYLLDSASVLEHPDPAVLLTHLTRDQADTVVRILRMNNLLH